MSQKVLNLKKAPGHQVLAKAGKKLLRPGGRSATEKLFAAANFQPGDSVLELAASFGYSAIALAKKHQVKVTGIERNTDSVATAQANIVAAGAKDRVNVIEGDILNLDRVPGEFDFVLAEAILTMQSPSAKAKILRGVRNRLRPGGRFLSHELLVCHQNTEIHQALSSAIRVNASPLTKIEWVQACESAGLQVQFYHTGAMGLLNPKQMVNDEGWLGTMKITWNMLIDPQLRSRILQMRQVFQEYQDDLGYIILCAQRP
ncbi:class I SAM-dependent methyltransferase [Roseofilum sp. Guam]|uniref:SAM-dependent methyltransferase n=1 Tax=Roseofilum sp. Guam TaxID=2821502 RepID=UPI001B268F03|nr:class I SAM-dependent methyltransferase [Roseofilum sp. Guam]MBP0029268.1 class I SAM-dependent methyltransferase [Roseofilum sp. Guam]